MLRSLQRQQCECSNKATNAVIAHLTLKSKPTANIHTEKIKLLICSSLTELYPKSFNPRYFPPWQG